MFYFFSFLSFLNKIFLPKLHTRKMIDFQKYHFFLLGYKYWVTKNLLYYRRK